MASNKLKFWVIKVIRLIQGIKPALLAEAALEVTLTDVLL